MPPKLEQTPTNEPHPGRRADALRFALEGDIVTGVLKPGERLDEQTLADRFGVSRTPLREAFLPEPTPDRPVTIKGDERAARQFT